MSNLNLLFRKRIGMTRNEVITFDKLDATLAKIGKAIPFENLRVIDNRTTDITKENLISKIVKQNEGGLCYELNSILYLFLKENGFNIFLRRGVVYDHTRQEWSKTGKSHVANLIRYNDQYYLIDTGFGANIPLKPVPLNGEIVVSNNGEFKVEKENSEHGQYIFYMKLKHKDKDWKIGYAFDSKEVINDITILNDIQNIIIEHPESSFNKRPIITRLTDKGNITLTDTTFTQWVDGKVEKQEIENNNFKKIADEYFGLTRDFN